MKETIEDIAHKQFFDICEKNPMDIDIFFLENTHFLQIDYLPKMAIYIPLPREIENNHIYEGIIFSHMSKNCL